MSNVYIQLDMFDKDEGDRLWREIAAINRGREKQRKRLFSDISELKREIKKLKEEIKECKKI